jgi:hypothetical protein
MKFVKLRLHNVPQKGTIEEWRMVIDNLSDLGKYHDLDAYLNATALVDVEGSKHHAISQRGSAISRMIELKHEGSPVCIVAEMTDKKYLGMERHILKGNTLAISNGGSWCLLDGYISTWNAEVLATIEKDDIGFPVDEDVINAETIILENSDKSIPFKNLYNIVGDGTVAAICNLKQIDVAYVLKAINNCKNVFIESQLIDDNQIDDFMKLFSTVKRKNIYLSLTDGGKEKIKSHCLFEKNSEIHNIVFL